VDGIPAKKISETACEVHVKELNKIDFGCVIGDEIHRVMDPSSKVARALKAATGKAEFRFGLSGTPIASAPDNLFSPLNWLMPEAYPSKTKYLDRMCLTTYNAWGATVVIGIKPERQQEFFAGIDPFLRRMPKEVILPFLPPIVRERRDVEMAAKQKKTYEQMRDQMVAELEGDLLITTSPLTKMTRMLQFSSSFAEIEYRPVRNKETKEVEDVPYVKLSDPSCKLDAFMEDLDDFGGESIVVFAVSSQLVRMLSARLEKAKIPHGLITGEQDAVERQHHMDQFQSGKTKLILCTIAAGGTGITLTTGSVAVFLQRSWSMIENLQAEARVHRIGSEQHDFVRIIDYVTAGSVEEAVFEAVEAKSQQLEFILRDKDLIKKTLKGIKE
jgi:SNF2 family DNA or RNA helicase